MPHPFAVFKGCGLSLLFFRQGTALSEVSDFPAAAQSSQIVYSPTGAKLALMNGQSLVKAFIPLPGQATAVYTSSGLDHYRHPDWLGSARLSSSTSQSATGFLSYAPFGETETSGGTADPSFTGQNQDTVPNLYDFPAREYDPLAGRWPSPDPGGLLTAHPVNPQSWNRYAYVRNNPLGLIDPLGLDCIYGDEVISGDCLSEDDNGVYVDGTVTSAWIDSNGNLQYTFTPSDCSSGSLCVGYGSETDFANWASNGPNFSNSDSFGPDASLQGSILGEMLNQQQCPNCMAPLTTAANTMTNPRTYALWFGGSVVGGAVGSASALLEIGASATLQIGATADALYTDVGANLLTWQTFDPVGYGEAVDFFNNLGLAAPSITSTGAGAMEGYLLSKLWDPQLNHR